MEPDAALDLLARRPERTGVFCDFDGTLAEIVDRPADARPWPGAEAALSELARSLAAVGVISGRALGDLRSRIDAPGVVLAASYGRQRSDREQHSLLPSHRWNDISEEAEREVASLPGVVVEGKEAGVALHFRGAPDLGPEVQRIAEEVAARHGLEVQAGRMVAELIAPGPGKGDALRDLTTDHDVDVLAYVGDDVSDLHALHWARSSDRECVLIGVGSNEAPAELREAADIVMDGPAEVVGFLERLAERIRPQG